MNLDDVYKSDWLRAANLDGKDMVVTIKHISTSEFKDGRVQMVLEFSELDQKLGCNATNARTIAALYGRETDAWIGKCVKLYPTRVEFQGKRVDAIRIDDRIPAAGETRVATPTTVLASGNGSKTDDIPF